MQYEHVLALLRGWYPHWEAMMRSWSHDTYILWATFLIVSAILVRVPK